VARPVARGPGGFNPSPPGIVGIMNRNRAWVVSAVRAGWGGVLLVAPAVALRIGGPGFRAPHATAIARVLGARHIAQAAVTALAPTPAVGMLGAATDALHASGNVLAAAVSPRWRRVALIDAGIAAAFAAATWNTTA
jgi:hypothetical protein